MGNIASCRKCFDGSFVCVTNDSTGISHAGRKFIDSTPFHSNYPTLHKNTNSGIGMKCSAHLNAISNQQYEENNEL